VAGDSEKGAEEDDGGWQANASKKFQTERKNQILTGGKEQC